MRKAPKSPALQAVWHWFLAKGWWHERQERPSVEKTWPPHWKTTPSPGWLEGKF